MYHQLSYISWQRWLWDFGLLTDPAVWLPRPASVGDITWDVAPADGLFHGEAYGDGSAFYGTFAATARSGWAVTQVEERNGEMHVTAAARGPLPGLTQGTPPAEAYSLLQYLAHAGLPPHSFATDCEWVRTSWLAGPSSTGSGKVHANLWRDIFLKAELPGGQVGGSGIWPGNRRYSDPGIPRISKDFLGFS